MRGWGRGRKRKIEEKTLKNRRMRKKEGREGKEGGEKRTERGRREKEEEGREKGGGAGHLTVTVRWAGSVIDEKSHDFSRFSHGPGRRYGETGPQTRAANNRPSSGGWGRGGK